MGAAVRHSSGNDAERDREPSDRAVPQHGTQTRRNGAGPLQSRTGLCGSAYSLRLGRPNPHQVKLLYSAGDPASREPAHDCGDEFTPVRPRGITSRGRSLANCSCREPDPDAAAGRSVRRGPGDRLRTRVAPGRDREGICSRNRRVRRATRVPVSRPFHCMEAKSCVANSARREVRGGWRTPPVMPEEPPAT